MPALGVFLAWLMVTIFAACVAGLLLAIFPRAAKENDNKRSTGSIGFGAKLAHQGAA